MIAKRIEAKKQTSSLRRLADYIANPAKQADLRQKARAGEGIAVLAGYMDKKEAIVTITNCGFDTLPRAVKEMQAVQAKNTRSKNDKTYHMVLSFREGEQPDPEVMARIEDQMVEHLGFGEHQRISAVHTDTTNWHIHVAINKVHPGNYRNVEPYYDKFKMNEKCRELEAEFGLLPDNGIGQVRKPAMNKAQDKESHSGIVSLTSWVKETVANCLKELLEQDGVGWSDLHKELGRNGLLLRPRGAGFVIQDIESGITIKASTVDREFAKKRLEARLGKYQEPAVMHTVKRRYQAEPLQGKSGERDALWAKYRQEREGLKKERQEALGGLREQRRGLLKDRLDDIKKRKQEAFRSALMTKVQKKRVYAALQVQRLKALEKGRVLYQEKKQLVDADSPYLSWTAFLQKEVEQGSEVALKVLRERQEKGIHDQARYFAKGGVESHRIYEDLKYTVDKSGRIKYRLANEKGWVLDAGRRVMPGSLDREVLLMSLQIAIGKYGRNVQVHGDEAFVLAATQAAKSVKMDITINGSKVISKGQGKGRSEEAER